MVRVLDVPIVNKLTLKTLIKLMTKNTGTCFVSYE